jgi:hypothetical protein
LPWTVAVQLTGMPTPRVVTWTAAVRGQAPGPIQPHFQQRFDGQSVRMIGAWSGSLAP